MAKQRSAVHVKWLRRSNGSNQYGILRWTEGGERKSHTLGYVSELAAEEARADMEAALRLGVSLPSTEEPAVVTVDDLVENYLTAIEVGAGRGTPKYRRNELLHCQRIGQHLGSLAAEALTEHNVRGMVQSLRGEVVPATSGLRGVRRKSSIEDLLGCLRRVFRQGCDSGLASKMPPRLSRKSWPSDERPARRLTEAEVRDLVEAATALRPALGRLLQFLAWCPRRPVAVFSIRRRDCSRVLDPNLPRSKALLYIERDKAGVGRGWCPLTEPALNALREQLASLPADGSAEDLVWTSARGRPWDAALLAEPFGRAVAAAGLNDVVPYDLRKFGASMVYARAAGNVKVVQEFTGHADVQQLIKRYVSAPQGAAELLATEITWEGE